MMQPVPLTSYRPYWAKRFGVAPVLPMSRAEMDALGWDECDVILVTGDAYIDHPSFGMALVGRLLEAQGFRVGIIAQPDWQSAEPFRALGKPRLFFGVTAGNMDSMVNRYTADRKIRSDDAYTPGGEAGMRPDRALLVYAARCREAYPDVALVVGGIEASLRRIAHYDYWSDKVRRSALVDSKADLLLYGNAERAIVELAHRLGRGERIADIRDLRGSAFLRDGLPEGWTEIDSRRMDRPGKVAAYPDPYAMTHPSPASGRGVGGEGKRGSAATSAPASGVGGEGKQPAAPRPIPAELLAHARGLRTHQTDAEQLLWGGLRAKRFLGLKFRRQHLLEGYILDFYCDELKLVIELDGGQHAEQQRYDDIRTARFSAEGITVLRFWNNQVLGETEAVLEAIYREVCRLQQPSPPTPPPLAGEGEKASSGELHSSPSSGGGKTDAIHLPPPASRRGAGGEGKRGSVATSAPATSINFIRRVDVHTDRAHQAVRLPAYEEVSVDAALYAHASRVLHLESNPGNARALVQRHGRHDVWLNPPPIPLTTREMDYVYDLPYARRPHPAYGEARIPAWEMIRFSVNIMRGCFGGCTFCSITEHEGRIIQSRSEASILREVEEIRDKVPGFTGVISDLGGPTANMYRMACKSREIEAACRKLSCVYPDICDNLLTDHAPLIALYRKARALSGIKKILIGSGLRYDLAMRSPEYVKELVTHHVGGYLKIAPEHTEAGPLSKMMKPGIGSYERFKAMFEKFSREAGKEQYLIPYFIAAHPGTSDEDMLNLALWLKKNGFRLDQVQTFTPTPMAMATAMYHSGKNPLRKVTADSEAVRVPKGERVRRLHKAFLRYHDPNNWPMLREALQRMGRADLIGNGKHHLIPAWQPAGTGDAGNRRGVERSPAKARTPLRRAQPAPRKSARRR